MPEPATVSRSTSVRTYVTVLLITLNGCALESAQAPLLTLPDPGDGPTATLAVRGSLNTGSIQHHHLLHLNGTAVGQITDAAVQLKLPVGEHRVRLTCHTHNTLSGSGLPVNYNVVDAETQLTLELADDQKICLKASISFTSCAALEVTAPEFCSGV